MGVFLALVGAFETIRFSLAWRLAYWVPLMVLGMFAAITCTLVMRLTIYKPLRLEERPALEAGLIILTATPLIAAVSSGYQTLFSGREWSAGLYGFYLLPAFVITVAMTGISLLVNRKPVQSHAFAPADAQPVAFLERLPFKYRQARILALSAEDHYLRVHTAAGETLILMRLYDAVRELEGIEGSQVHRSWWVAKEAVADIERREGRITLRLDNGLIVPVSRSYQKALKASGWL